MPRLVSDLALHIMPANKYSFNENTPLKTKTMDKSTQKLLFEPKKREVPNKTINGGQVTM